MARLSDTTVQTATADYSFRSREEAEAFFLSLKNRAARLDATPIKPDKPKLAAGRRAVAAPRRDSHHSAV